MTLSISHLVLEKARDAALNSFSSASDIRLFAKIAWANANMDATPIGGPADIKPINKFCEDAKQNIEILTNQCQQAEQVLTTEILDYIAMSNAPHNLPGVTIGNIRYTTAHQAALYFLKGINACLKATFQQIQWKRDTGVTIDKKMLGNAIVADVETLPLPNFLGTDIEIEAANALAFWRSEFKQTTDSITDSKNDKPNWNSKRRELIFEGKVLKTFRQPAPNQIAILEAFQQDGWPDRIDDPLPYAPNADTRQRLGDAVHRLNKSITSIVFELDGTSVHILWKRL